MTNIFLFNVLRPMRGSKLTHLVEPLFEMLCQYDMIIKGFRERTGARIAGLSCGMFPEEITVNAGLIPLRLPAHLTDYGACGNTCCCEKFPDGIYDVVLVPRGCILKHGSGEAETLIQEFDCPEGWGEESSKKLRSSLFALLESTSAGPGERYVQGLREATREYNALRRVVRGISSVRREKPDLLSCQDLAVIYEAAVALPPSVTIGHLVEILRILNQSETAYGGGMVPSLAYASFIKDPQILDAIEDAGCLIVEDDFCNGRRQFDMSYNDESDDLFAEILDSYSYRPRCPTVRPLGERFELFYKMVKNSGIDLVIFIQDRCCPAKQRDIDELRVRLMRTGIDPVIATSEDAADKARNYAARA